MRDRRKKTWEPRAVIRRAAVFLLAGAILWQQPVTTFATSASKAAKEKKEAEKKLNEANKKANEAQQKISNTQSEVTSLSSELS